MNAERNAMRSISIVCALVLFTCLSASAEEKINRTDGWEGLTLNVSTADEAIKLFGQPVKDKDKNPLEVVGIRTWLSGKEKEKVFRILTYKKLRDLPEVQLAFLDNKLAAIILEFPNAEKDDSNWTSPDDLERLFAIGFKQHKRKVGGTLPPPSEFQAGAPADLKKQEYDFWYDMIAVSERSFIVATVDNYKYINAYGLFGRDPTVGAKRKKREKLNANHKYPGFVSGILIISRTLASQ